MHFQSFHLHFWSFVRHFGTNLSWGGANRGVISLATEFLIDKNCTYPEWAKELAKSLWTPHIQHNPYLTCHRLVNATELWAPERPDTETVSFPKQSISWTLDIKRGTHNTIIHYLFTTHTYFSFQNLHISDLYTHNCLKYIVYLCYFVHCLFVYYYFVVPVTWKWRRCLCGCEHRHI